MIGIPFVRFEGMWTFVCFGCVSDQDRERSLRYVALMGMELEVDVDTKSLVRPVALAYSIYYMSIKNQVIDINTFDSLCNPS